MIVGPEHSGQILDGGGAALAGDALSDAMVVRSLPEDGYLGGGAWRRPEDIIIRNWIIHGSIRLYGLGQNGEAEGVRASSLKEGHTQRAQAAAPRKIAIENCRFEGRGRIPVYIAPGCTEVVVRGCVFTGRSVATAIYLCAETAHCLIEGCTFDMRLGREVIAIDGSAHNTITGNWFTRSSRGGIYVYRNAGEGGTVRHQAPVDNLIAGNRFGPDPFWSRPARIIWPHVWLGSRSRWMRYLVSPWRDQDAGYPWGSSINDEDQAQRNIAKDNGPITVRDWQ